jgi:glycerophosphoryl diester phosphodiesterase
MEVIAHRGASFYAPENTLPAIRKAGHLGATVVELDVRLSWDRRLLIFHDPELDRTTNGTGTVEWTRYNIMRSLDAGAWFDSSFYGTHIPSLAEELREAKLNGLKVVLDVKASPDWAGETREMLIQDLQEYGNTGVIVAAFRKATVERCVSAGLQCAHISNGTLDGPASVDIARSLGAKHLLLNHTVLDSTTMQRAKALGIEVYAWTVNEEVDWQRLRSLNVDGILTDRPAYLVEFIAP